MKKWMGLSLAFVLTASMLAGCGQGNKDTNNSNAANPAKGQEVSANEDAKIAAIKKAGKIVLGTSADYPPYEFHKSVNGKDEIVGFDIEIAKEIAKDLGVQLEIKDMKFDGLLAALQTDNVDMVIAGMTPDEERKKSVDFSKIYYTAVQGIVVRAEDKDKYKTVDDLKTVKLGVQKGAIQEQIAKEQLPQAQTKAISKISDLMLELKTKRLDALIVEVPVANAYISKNPDLAIAPAKLNTEEAGSAIALKKGNTKLAEQMNQTLDRLIKDKKIDAFVATANDMVE
jgi:arginine/lysine/histidine transporter system substrate-binding protein